MKLAKRYVYRPSPLKTRAIIVLMVHSLHRLISILFIADVAVPLADLFFGDQSQRFDPDHQVNLSAFLVGLQLFFAAVVMLEIYIRERRESIASLYGTWLWPLLAIAFLALAVDANFTLPQILATQNWASPDTMWLLLLPYPVIVMPLVLLIGLSVIGLTLSRFGNHPFWSRCIAAAIVCWFLATVLGYSLKLGLMPPGSNPVGWVLQQVLNLLGLTLYLWSVAQYAGQLRSSFALRNIEQLSGRLVLRSITIIACVTLLGTLVLVLLATSNPAYLYRYNGNFFAKHGNYDRAATAFNRSLDEDPNNLKSLCGLANAYLNADSPQKAITVCDQILSIDNKSLFALNLKATLLSQSGRHAAAEKYLRQASILEPRNAALWRRLGSVQEEQQKLPEALKNYYTSLELNPEQSSLRAMAEKLQKKINLNTTVQTPSKTVDQFIATVDKPFEDGWKTEAFTELADKQLKKLGELLKTGSAPNAEDISQLITTNFSCESLLPKNLETVFSDQILSVSRGNNPSDSRSFHGANGLSEALSKLIQNFHPSQNIESKFKIFRVLECEEDNCYDTKIYVAFSGNTPQNIVEQNATWSVRWRSDGEGRVPRIDSIDVEDFELSRLVDSKNKLFTECTPAVLSGNACYKDQLLRGHNHWLNTSQRRRHLLLLGTPGIAVSDVNGDGLEDLYLCQEDGLPNRLFLHQKDNRLVDVSRAWGVDWLWDSRCPLFFDWDNDGDQDLAVSMLGGVFLAENENNQSFTPRGMLKTSDDAQSITAADYDQDGDIDLFVCVYKRDVVVNRINGSPLPTEGEDFVYHDANTGGKNSLFRNDGGGTFTNVTDAVGIGQNNQRYSYAATWDDYDNDGDVDLYVANDFGRDNLYQNTNGSFIDIAAEANVENSASGMGVVSGDYNHDGWIDIYVTNMWSSAGNRISTQDQFKPDAPLEVKKRIQGFARGNTLLQNDGTGRFKHKSAEANVEVGRWAYGCQFIDLNNDSWEDLMVANGFITGESTKDL